MGIGCIPITKGWHKSHEWDHGWAQVLMRKVSPLFRAVRATSQHRQRPEGKDAAACPRTLFLYFLECSQTTFASFPWSQIGSYDWVLCVQAPLRRPPSQCSLFLFLQARCREFGSGLWCVKGWKNPGFLSDCTELSITTNYDKGCGVYEQTYTVMSQTF